MKELNETEKQVMKLYESFSQSEIASKLGLSASRVSQIHSSALVKLRSQGVFKKVSFEDTLVTDTNIRSNREMLRNIKQMIIREYLVSHPSSDSPYDTEALAFAERVMSRIKESLRKEQEAKVY